MNRNSRLSASAVRKASYGAALVLAGILGCSGSSDSPSGTGGSGTGGKSSTGGSSSTGGASNTGGSATGGSDSSTGGSSNTGGSDSSTGGSSDTGGSSSGTGGSSSGTGGKGGASSSTGGKGGAGTSTGGSSGGGSTGSADCASLKLCEDFETGTLDTKTWKLQQGGFTAGIVSDQAHGGTHSFHVMFSAASGSASISETKTFPSSDFWGRAWVRLKGAPDQHQMYIYMNFPGDQARMLNRLGSEAIVINYQGGGDPLYNATTNFPLETWFCYEWHMTASGITAYKDGMQLTFNKMPKGATGGTALGFGVQRFAAGSNAGEMWYDDIAVGDAQIGCK